MTENRKEMPELFKNKKDCCACGACLNVCPKDAISMNEDESGFLYPQIDDTKCINCKMCQKVCAYQNKEEKNVPLRTWVAVSKDEETLKKSSSGGAFYTLAKSVVEQGGCAVGAAFDNNFNVHHILAENFDDLHKVQGSKYTQSDTELIFREVKKKLVSGKIVLFSGCPCQVAGLKSYLGKEYDNLITIDLICHGVPSNKMFKDYIDILKKNKDICEFNFRDKSFGWGIYSSVINSNDKKSRVYSSTSSYMYYFLNGVIYRENCYSCKYACKNRPGDLTIGDYWGIEREHPELIEGKKIDDFKGVSVVIANTQRGIKFVDDNAGLFKLFDSTFEKASRYNTQLNEPTKYDLRRVDIIEMYKNGGYSAIEKNFQKSFKFKKYKSIIKSLIPHKMKRKLKKILRRGQKI